MAVVLADLLNERHVVLELTTHTRDEALREIVMTMQLDAPEAFLREVIARESEQSTIMEQGVALPHARTDLLQRIVLGIGRSVTGVDWSEGATAQLIFVIGVPQRMVSDYLVCVGAVARLTRDAHIRDSLLHAASAAELIDLLRKGSLVLE
ncbi:hypothetical protein BH18VER1_BH18VER1_05650 [soil metagenome]